MIQQNQPGPNVPDKFKPRPMLPAGQVPRVCLGGPLHGKIISIKESLQVVKIPFRKAVGEIKVPLAQMPLVNVFYLHKTIAIGKLDPVPFCVFVGEKVDQDVSQNLRLLDFADGEDPGEKTPESTG